MGAAWARAECFTGACRVVSTSWPAAAANGLIKAIVCKANTLIHTLVTFFVKDRAKILPLCPLSQHTYAHDGALAGHYTAAATSDGMMPC